MNEEEHFPRDLTQLESELLLWVLPEDRPGYNEMRRYVRKWKVTSRGRRGAGNYILSPLDERIDLESPLPQVLAYGVLETDRGEIAVSVREPMGKQIEFEITKLGAGELDSGFHEHRRWTLSAWHPSLPCPKCGKPCREVFMRTSGGRSLTLGVCRGDERLWIYDRLTGMNIPVPITNFYNELMLHKKVRDPEIALDPRRFFADLPGFRDRELIEAFRTYNMIRTKVSMEDDIVVPASVQPSFVARLVTLVRQRFSKRDQV
ncbi:MAG: hypothetical protein HBSIN02_01200 [Bacteroidia bacterium]|nr:MAG: hypothetical protein HBSIN02_01200 [Bacteroidia bacterium]